MTATQELLSFLEKSPTPFHAVKTMKEMLLQAGYTQLSERDPWNLTAGARYFVVRNDSSIVAFINGIKDPVVTGLRIIGAHTDSPCLKVKPRAEVKQKGFFQLGVEVYGGALLATWFDRDLSLAGRVTFQQSDGSLSSRLINFKNPIATVASVAIHLDRTQNESRNINRQKDIPPVLAQLQIDQKPDFNALLAEQLEKEYQGLSVGRVLDHELYFYDTQPAALVGLNQEFIAGARLDNLLSCFIGLKTLLSCDGQQSVVLVCNDHEEVGSGSAAGARGTLLKQILSRWAGSHEQYCRMIDSSMLISADNAHALHPNYSAFHEPEHGPQLNQGPVIKVNANQSYASNSVTQAIFRHACLQAGIQVQDFVTRTDLGCGSTIGPLTAMELGIRTLDVGMPTLGMHSIRELSGSSDVETGILALKAFCDLLDVARAGETE